MGIAPHLFTPLGGVEVVTALLLLASLWARWSHLRALRKRSEAELSRLNNLHLLTTALAKNNDPARMAEETLERTLRMLGLTQGFIFLRVPGIDGLEFSRAQGISSQAVGRLLSGPLRTYLASCADRWGSLMVFPDLRLQGLIEAWQRDPLFTEFYKLLRAEGLRSLLIVGLQFKERPYGALLAGTVKLRTFEPSELRLMLAVGNQLTVALENHILHKESARHNEELKRLHRVAEELSGTFDMGEQLGILRRELRELLGVDNPYLAFQESPSGRLEEVVAFGGGPPPAEARGIGLAEFVVRNGAPLRIGGNLPETARRLGIASFDARLRSWSGVPIHFSDGSKGVLAVGDFEQVEALDDRRFGLLGVLAGEVAAAIEKARLFQQEQRRARHLALLNELARKATTVLSPPALLADICGQIRSAFGYDLVRIETMDPGRDELTVDAQDGYGPELVGRRFRMGEGLSGIAAQTGAPALADVVDKDPRYIPTHPGVRSSLSLPLRSRDQTLGTLSVESFREHGFSQQDLLTLLTLADQLAIALHNAKAFQVAREQAITDGLTGLKTHRFFMEALQAEWRHATRSSGYFSLIMMDLDGFKQVNLQHGHSEGDKVLAAVARVLESRSRQSNVVARYGGDEFAVLMVGANTEQAEMVAERLRAGVAADLYLSAHGVTASIGLSTFPSHGATPEELLRVADSGVYLAKHDRGNCVRLASRLEQTPDPNWDQRLLEAYLGVAVKRMFSTGPEAFNQYLQRFQQEAQKPEGESVSVLDIVTALAYAIDAKDHYTRGHSQTVSRLASQLAVRAGLSEAQVEEVRLAGIVHDIGKIGVPETILNKPTRLTQDEFEVVKTHAVLGDKILEPLKLGAMERIREMIRHHHEYVDGRGYPDGLRAEKIPIGARILTIADSFDTMISDRAYKKGRSVEEAAAELRRCAGSQFDPALVETFLASIITSGDRGRQRFQEVAN